MHLIVGDLHLLMKTFCRKTNQNPPYAFVITYPSLSPVVPTSARAVEMCSILKPYWNILKSKSILYITVPWIKAWDNKSLKKNYPSSGRKGNIAVTTTVSDIVSCGLVTSVISKQHFKILSYHKNCLSGSKLMRTQGWLTNKKSSL